MDGSATTSGSDDHRIVASAINEVIDEVSASFSGVRPNVNTDREADFTKEGALETIEAILDILITGTMRAAVDISVSASVSWRGRRLSRQFDLTADVRLPVDNVNYEW